MFLLRKTSSIKEEVLRLQVLVLLWVSGSPPSKIFLFPFQCPFHYPCFWKMVWANTAVNCSIMLVHSHQTRRNQIINKYIFPFPNLRIQKDKVIFLQHFSYSHIKMFYKICLSIFHTFKYLRGWVYLTENCNHLM